MSTCLPHELNPNMPSCILANTIDFVSRAILKKQYASGLHPVEYFSKCLTPTEANYFVIERELLGCLLAILCWCLYLMG